MAELDENLDLLDLEEDADLDTLSESANPFASPRPKKPWLLFCVGLLVIALATYIIVRSVGSDSDSSVEINLDTPQVVTEGGDDINNPVTAPLIVPENDTVVKQNDVSGVPVRTVEDRKDVKFNPNKQDKPVEAPVSVKNPGNVLPPKPLAERKSGPPVKRAAKQAHNSGGWYVQFGSYSTKELAQRAQTKIRGGHTGLFTNKQFVILAAVLPNGKTTYRLRIAFPNSSDATGFCNNAKSDGLDCYISK